MNMEKQSCCESCVYFDYDEFYGEEMTVTLVPYGCTNLRITYFPRADKK